jgi:hypothetical protein
MERDDALMLLRLAMQVLAGILIARGMGDAALWEAVTGLVVMAGGVAWSAKSRRKLRAQALSGQAALGMAREMVGRR